MHFQLLAVSSRCATVRIVGNGAYFCASPLTVLLNGEQPLKTEKNCFTLTGLCPDCDYRLTAGDLVLDFKTPQETAFLDIRAFGAVGDGATDCTRAITAAICCCPAGGTVYIPAGRFLSYPIFLKSGVTLYLEQDAVLLGASKREAYPVLPGMIRDDALCDKLNLGSWEGNPLDTYASLITAVDCENICVCGKGVIDANAAEGLWWQNAKQKHGAWRPRTIFLNRCKGISLFGITVKNSPSWTLHPYYCDDLMVFDITITNPYETPNTDGIDVDSCQNVRIAGAHISVGDDCIALKSGKYYMGKFHQKATRNVKVENCFLAKGHGAVVIGSEISAGVYEVTIENCLMKETDRGLRIKTRRGRGRGSVVDNIRCRNITMDRVKTPFVINMFYCCDPDGKSEYVASKEFLPVDELTPCIGRVEFRNIVCTNAQHAAMYFYGLPEQPIAKIEVSDIRISFDENAEEGCPAMMTGIAPARRLGLFAENVDVLKLKSVEISGCEGEPLQLGNIFSLVRG